MWRVGLVVTVTALSNGLDDAQQKGVEAADRRGTDMSVTRPLRVSNNGQSFTPGGGGPGGAGAGLSQSERDALRRENGGGAPQPRSAGKPGDALLRDTFLSATRSLVPRLPGAEIAGQTGVKSAAGALTLTSLHVEGTVPQDAGQGGFGGFRGGAGGGPPGGGGGGGGGGGPAQRPTSLPAVTGVDQSQPSLAPVTPGELSSGSYFSSTGGAYQAILGVSYAQ